MKRKIFAFITVVVILFSLFAIPTYADTFKSQIKISEDYSYLEYDGMRFVPFDESKANLKFGGSGDVTTATRLSDTQRDNIMYISVTAYNRLAFINLNIEFKTGGMLYVTYIREDLLVEYEKFKTSTDGEYILSWDYDYGTDFNTMSEDIIFTADTLTVSKHEIFYYVECDSVYFQCKNGYFCEERGTILRQGKEFYYLDSVVYATDFLSSADGEDTVTLYHITDPATVAHMSEYYMFDLDYEDYEDGSSGTSTTDTLGSFIGMTLLLSMIFVLIPLVIAIPGIILTFTNKKPYKWLFLTSAIVAIIAITLFLALTVGCLILVFI